ncbi:hypothetical protein [Halalkalibacter urbisdiaboli]|nr:hypothetical protein [Halalkalibacter urbisdiaboli]
MQNVSSLETIYYNGDLHSFLSASIFIKILDIAEDAESQSAPEVKKNLKK